MNQEPWPVFIYGIFAPDGVGKMLCLYVGQTSNPFKRMRGHIPSGDNTGRVFKVIGFAHSDYASAMERDFILAYKAIGEAPLNSAIPMGNPAKRKKPRYSSTETTNQALRFVPNAPRLSFSA